MPLFFLQARITAGGKKLSFGISCSMTFHHMPSKHAEMDASQKIMKKKDLPRAVDYFVIRYTKTGVLGESRPCFHCLTAMNKSKLNIKDVYYSTSEGTIVREKFSVMLESDNTYISSGMRKYNKWRRKYNTIPNDSTSGSSSGSSTSESEND